MGAPCAPRNSRDTSWALAPSEERVSGVGRVLPVLHEGCTLDLSHCRCCRPEAAEAPGSCRAISLDPC